jgi:uncharacterized protein (DUF305 family)
MLYEGLGLPNRVITLLVIVSVAVSCRSVNREPAPPIVQPGAPGQASQVISPERAVDLSRVRYTSADVRFMQGMIGHHAQALEMVALLGSRTKRDDMQLLARRIALSQEDEIVLMQRWLQVRGQDVPDVHAHHAHGAVLMPGMLTSEEMARLEAASGGEFDRLFLEFMVKHHEGALVMVRELFAAPEAGQETDIFTFANDVDADQRIEIARMSAMLMELQE